MAEAEKNYYQTPSFEKAIEAFPPNVKEVTRLASDLCALPGISVPPQNANMEAIQETHNLAKEYAKKAGLQVIEFPPDEGHPYPFLMVTFKETNLADREFNEAVALMGHLDVVPATEAGQFNPYIQEGNLFARGAADMKTVVATYLVWMAEMQKKPDKKPPFIAMISSCEENGSDQPNHTLEALKWLKKEKGVTIRFSVVGERTGELEWMAADTPVGPIMTENRAWRWTQIENENARGKAALRDIAMAVQEGRTRIDQLNREAVPAKKKAGQKGVISGFLNPFTHIPGDEVQERGEGRKWIKVERQKGASVHAAATGTAAPSLIELFQIIEQNAEIQFGAKTTHMREIRIGQEGNFNTYDGSGAMVLSVNAEGDEPLLQNWIQDQVALTGLTLSTHAENPVVETLTQTTFGLDVREILDHKEPVETYLKEIRTQFETKGWAVETRNDRPSWQCPADHPDLMNLQAAYTEVIGEPSPSYVKLYGNDGGSLAALQQETLEGYAEQGRGDAVVFGQVGRSPHGKGEFHRLSSIQPYLDILTTWSQSYQ
ncbi:MAG: hypothetical protein ACD_28C00035G0004 [uncultured bacterium]|nr:MAG: hypothetical protein ACD_28C00035G0004 [uncultured bacterium]KKT75753.1 MAG: hypothetical protein UW70_C0029G0009 [Candidatus Peregrinibacteria bacterium GW2011_GWA2_44_7]